MFSKFSVFSLFVLVFILNLVVVGVKNDIYDKENSLHCVDI